MSFSQFTWEGIKSGNPQAFVLIDNKITGNYGIPYNFSCKPSIASIFLFILKSQ